MKKYILKKLLTIIPVMLIVSILTFELVSIAPSDPAQIILGANGIKVTEEALELKREELGLNDPLHVQYLRWLKGVVTLDLGKSYTSGKPVINDFSKRTISSFKLALLGLLILVAIAVPLGVFSAMYPNKVLDKIFRGISFLSVSMPAFWIGLMILYLFGVKLRLLSVIETEDGLGIILPALTLAFSHMGSYIRLIRGNMLEVLNKDYIKAAKAKGLSTKVVMFKHALKNALLPIMTKFGITVGGFIGGSTIIEIVFSFRGLGTYIMSAITNQDYPVIQTYVIFMAFVIVMINLIVDILYVAVDPRIELK